MRTCPGCDYLVPAAWESCKRCGGALAPVGDERLVGVATRAASAPVARRVETVPGVVAFAPLAFAPNGAPTADLRPCERIPGRYSSVSEPASVRVRRRRVPFVGVLAFVALVGCGYLAYEKIAHPPVPAELRAWVTRGQGVDYAPVGAGFSVSLPSAPMQLASRVTVANGVASSVPIAEARAGRYTVGASWLAVPRASLTVNAADPATTAAAVGARAPGFLLQVQTPMTFHGLPAVNAEFDRNGDDGHALFVLSGNRIYVVYTIGEGEGTAGFDHLVASLVLSA